MKRSLSPALTPCIAALAGLFLAGCSLRPIYAQSGHGAGVATKLRHVAIAPIPDRSGFLVRSALEDIFDARDSNATYRLEISLNDRIEGYGIGGDDSISRENRTLKAQYRLINSANEAVCLTGETQSGAGLDVINSSELATVAAENSALERLARDVARHIAARIALYLKQRPRSDACYPVE